MSTEELALFCSEQRFPSANISIPLLRLGLRADRRSFGLWNALAAGMHRRLMSLLLLIAPLTVSAGDLSGKWTGAMELKTPDGQAQSMPVRAEFKQDGKSVTGTAGREGDEQLTIEKGTIENNKFTFEVQAPDGTYAASLTVSDAQLQGEVTFNDPDGNKQTAKLTLTRDK